MAINKIDSNITGLRYAEEKDLRELPPNPVFYLLEPNSYNDFGGQISTIARNPINPSRQRQKGVTTDLDASGGFQQDLTMNNSIRLFQGFFFADIREPKTTAPMNSDPIAIIAVTGADKKVTAASGLAGWVKGHIVRLSGFSTRANNKVCTVASNSLAGEVVFDQALADETPPAAAKMETVGIMFADGDVKIELNANLVRLVSTAFDMRTLKLVPGSWIFLGGDETNAKFVKNKGFARISVIDEHYIEFDKTDWKGEAEVGTGKAIKLFFGEVLKNEADPELIKRRTYHVERTLGHDADGQMSEYLVGAVPNELKINIAQADKITMDMSFVAVDNEQRTGAQGLKTGTRPYQKPASAFNTSSDFARIKLALVDEENSAPKPLFAYATEMNLTLNNNVTPNKAIGVLGAFDTSAGTFEVGGSLTAYFNDVTSAQAVRNNGNVTIDIIMLKKNEGMVWDIPLLSLGNGRLNVEQDQAITLPLDTNAAECKFNHTLLFQRFTYLPDVAGGV